MCVITTPINSHRKELEERITEVYQEMDSNPKFTRLKTLSSNMKLYLIETLFGGVLIYLLSFSISSNWSYLVQALPIYPFIIASIIILPINGFLSLEYERRFKTVIKKSNVLELANNLIKQENIVLAHFLDGEISSEELILQNQIINLVMYAPETLVYGPRNQSITFKNRFQLIVDDHDEYNNLLGRLLIIRTKFPHIKFTGTINLTITPTIIRKYLISLNEAQKLILLPKHRPLVLKLKTLANQLSRNQSIHINLQNQEFNLIIEDYKLFEETSSYKEVTKLIMLCSKYFNDILN